MPKQRVVNIPAGAAYVSIRATLPAHYTKVYENGERLKDLEYRLPDDNFVQVYRTVEGDVIELIGHGRSGILGRPPDFNASAQPSVGDVILHLRTQDATETNVTVYESENEL